MGGLLLEEDLLVTQRIVDPASEAGKKIHDFLLARAKKLAGHLIDFDKTPVVFALADQDTPNAFFVAGKAEKPKRDEYHNKRFVKNPLGVPVIALYKGFIDMADNLDQLDYFLAHEITHKLIRRYGIANNSKGEEAIANLHAVDLMCDAGMDPKQALVMEKKVAAYHKARKEERDREYGRRDEETEGVEWVEIFDVHVTQRNTTTSIEASLTRLSHLIDDRIPTPLDKTVFDVAYDDPIESFLRQHNYEGQKPVGKLKLLIDCVDHLSEPAALETRLQAELEELQVQLDALPELNLDSYFYEGEEKRRTLQSKIKKIQKAIGEDYKGYFKGQVIEKKYQQKLAAMAEGIAAQAHEERRKKNNVQKPPELNTLDLTVYLQDRAYQHIQENGYPVPGDNNYFDATGILYTYFYKFLNAHAPHQKMREYMSRRSKTSPQIETDIGEARAEILNARTPDEFRVAAKKFERLTGMFEDIQSTDYGGNRYITKFDNLSFFEGERSYYGSTLVSELYPDLKAGHQVPWDNLVDVAKTDKKARNEIVSFLKGKKIEDYRITHGLPYIRQHGGCCFAVQDDGTVSGIERYDLDYAVHREAVQSLYDYVRGYFDNEAAYFDRVCEDVQGLTDADFMAYGSEQAEYNDRSMAREKIDNFRELYNSLPEVREKSRFHNHDEDRVTYFIARGHFSDHPMPGTDKKGNLWLTDSLLRFDNPVFQSHFGAAYKDKLIAQKESQKQRMFDAAFSVIRKTADLWREGCVAGEAIRAEEDRLQEEWEVIEAPQEKEKKKKEIHKQYRVVRLHNQKMQDLENVLWNFLAAVLDEGERNSYELNRLTPEQKRTLAHYVVQDEKGVFIEEFKSERYTDYCDYLGVLTAQVKRVVAGDYCLTDMMQVAADNLGYKASANKEEMKKTIEGLYVDDYRRHNASHYMGYLHVFEIMEALKRSSDMSINALSLAFLNIADSVRNRSNGRDTTMEIREAAYRKFVTESEFIPLVSQAVDFQDNYKGLSFDDMLVTVDNLASMRKHLAGLLVRRKDCAYYEEAKVIVQPEHRKFLNLLDKNIRGLLRKAQHQALQKDDALEKMICLHRLYTVEGGPFSERGKRATHLHRIVKRDKTLKGISDMSSHPEFWPEGALDHAKAYIYAKNTFLDDIEFENKVLNELLDKVDALPSGREKNECFFILLDRSLRSSYPETRQRLFDIYSADLVGKLGKDDRSEKYQKRLAIYLKSLEHHKLEDNDHREVPKALKHRELLSNSIAAADKYVLLRQVSDGIVSQEQTSAQIMKTAQVNLDADSMMASYLYGVGVDTLTEEMDRSPDSANKFIQFLNSKGEKADCADISSYIETSARRRMREIRDINELLKATTPLNCKMLYENFWSAPLAARAVIITRMLKSATASPRGDAEQSWERVFDIVMDNLIRPDDTSTESQYARDIMHSYIKARSDYERELILSAMMVANRNIGADAGNVGKALKLFLENMGPAEIKLGQAIASHPNTPTAIRTELQELKNAADKPARWTLYDWLKVENVPEELWKEEYVGEILGSASYYTTVAVGDDKVFRILRPEAREKATKGFRVIGDMVEDLKAKEGRSHLSYRELTASVSEMITQAARMSKIETDHDIGQTQYEDARAIYNGVTLKADGNTFRLKAMDWRVKGKNWIVLDRAKGHTFNDLPAKTPEQIAYKKSFAKAYALFELTNIFSGKKFDHDKHGAQLCIDTETGDVGIFDTGAMAVKAPTPEEQ